MKKPLFTLNPEQQEEVREVLKHYFTEEFELEIGNLQADIFIDFLSEHVGKHYYNLGVSDTMQAIKEKAEDLVLLLKD
jgi:uncharacterized protein (DUF2164 family)